MLLRTLTARWCCPSVEAVCDGRTRSLTGRLALCDLEVEEVAEPGSNSCEASSRHLTSNPRNPVAWEGAGLLRHDPGRPIERAWAIDADVVRPTPLDGRDRENDNESRDRVEVSGGCDDEHSAMTALLPAAHGLKGCPGDGSWSELKIRHGAVSLSSARSHSSDSSACDAAISAGAAEIAVLSDSSR